MNDVSVVNMCVVLLLPWMLGISIYSFLNQRSGYANLPIILGQGYILGVLANGLFLHAWLSLGLSWDFRIIASTIAALSIGFLGLQRRRKLHTLKNEPGTQTQFWEMLCIALFLILLCFRYATVLEEILYRPLFPWDAWMNWAPKAVVWFELKQLVTFVSPDNWLATKDQTVYTLGATGVWRFPPLIPMIQLWGMLGLGTHDCSAIYLPWLMAPVAFSLALYGYLRAFGHSALSATIACYIFLSLPYINVHSALAGYAEIWMTSTLGCTMLACMAWEKSNDRSQLFVALALITTLTQLKIPGMLFAIILLFTLLVAALHKHLKNAALYLACILVVSLLLLMSGIDMRLGSLGRFWISFKGVSVPYIGSFDFNYHSTYRAILGTLFESVNWHLLWYVAIGLAPLALVNLIRGKLSITLWTALSTSLLFILFVYTFTGRYKFALDFTQINRALIYLTPWVVIAISQLTGKPLAAQYPKQVPNQ